MPLERIGISAGQAGIAGGYVRISANGAIEVPVLGGDPAAPVDGELWRIASSLKFREGANTRSVEKTSNKGAANGYAGLTAGGKVSAGLVDPGSLTTAFFTLTQLATVLASATTETAGGSHGRLVIAQWNLPAITNGTSGATIQTETAVGSGVYNTTATVQQTTGVAITGPTIQMACSWWVPTGFRYKWTLVGAGATVMSTHNYLEF